MQFTTRFTPQLTKSLSCSLGTYMGQEWLDRKSKAMVEGLSAEDEPVVDIAEVSGGPLVQHTPVWGAMPLARRHAEVLLTRRYLMRENVTLRGKWRQGAARIHVPNTGLYM